MASNEHKNLSDSNLHVPKGFASASNNTVLTKNGSGSVEWLPTANTGFGQVIQYDFQGYSTTPSGESAGFYEFPVSISDGQSPFELAQDYGSGTISEETTLARNISFRCGSTLVPSNFQLTKLTGWLTVNASTEVTIALVKHTLTDGETTALPVTKLVEVTATGSTNTNTRSYSTTEFDVDTISAGDLIFPMVKTAESSGRVVYFHFAVQGIITT